MRCFVFFFLFKSHPSPPIWEEEEGGKKHLTIKVEREEQMWYLFCFFKVGLMFWGSGKWDTKR